MPASLPKVFLIVEPASAPFGWPDEEVALEFAFQGEMVSGFSTRPGKSSETRLDPENLRMAMREWLEQRGPDPQWRFFIRHAADPTKARVQITRLMRAVPVEARGWLTSRKRRR